MTKKTQTDNNTSDQFAGATANGTRAAAQTSRSRTASRTNGDDDGDDQQEQDQKLHDQKRCAACMQINKPSELTAAVSTVESRENALKGENENRT